MSQKILTPLKKIPIQIHNSTIFRKAQNIIQKQTKGFLCSQRQSEPYGFPEQTTASAYDPDLDILAIGTRLGSITVYGARCLSQTVGDLDEEIFKLAFIPITGKILSLSGKIHANRVTLWSFSVTECKWIKENSRLLENVRISSFALVPSSKLKVKNEEDTANNDNTIETYELLLGTEKPDILLFSLKDFDLSSNVENIWHEQFIVEKLLKGAAESCDCSIVSLRLDPNSGHRLLVAFRNGLVLSKDLSLPPIKEICKTSTNESGEEDKNLEELDETLYKKHWRVLMEPQPQRNFAVTSGDGESDNDASASVNLINANWVYKIGDQENSENTKLDVVVSFSDGHYVTASITELDNGIRVSMEKVIPYGPFPCCPITEIYAVDHNITSQDSSFVSRLIVFSGGMPRASYSDHHCVSFVRLDGQRQIERSTCLDLFSPVQQILPIHRPSETDPNHLTAILILCELEIVAIRMEPDSDGEESWKEVAMPYLNSMQFSPVTAVTWLDELSSEVCEALGFENQKYIVNQPWFINGGRGTTSNNNSTTNDKLPVLISGHWDGTVAFWQVDKGSAFQPIGSFSTLGLYNESSLTEGCLVNKDYLERTAWPPFRRAGLQRRFLQSNNAYPVEEFRSAVSKIEVLKKGDNSGVPDLLISTLGGHCVQYVWQRREQSIKNTLDSVCNVCVDLLASSTSVDSGTDLSSVYVWQDREALTVRGKPVVLGTALARIHGCYQAASVVSLLPPAPVLCAHFQPAQRLLAVGNAVGVAVVDCGRAVVVKTVCLLPADVRTLEMSSMLDVGVLSTLNSLGKQLGNNLRQSVRRLRKIRLPMTGSYTIKEKSAVAVEEVAEVKEVVEVKEGAEVQEVATVDAAGDGKPMETANLTAQQESHQQVTFHAESKQSTITTSLDQQQDKQTTLLSSSRSEVQQFSAVTESTVHVEQVISTSASKSSTADQEVSSSSPAGLLTAQSAPPTAEEEEADVEEAVPAAPPANQRHLTSSDLFMPSCRAVHISPSADSSTNSVLVVGTQRGAVLFYPLPSTDEPSTEVVKEETESPPATSNQSEESSTVRQLNLRQGVPIIGLFVLLSKVHQLACGEDTKRSCASDTTTTTAAAVSTEAEDPTPVSIVQRSDLELLIVTEDEVKIVSLPSLVTKHKHKVTYLFAGSNQQVAESNSNNTNNNNSSGAFSRTIPRSPTGTLIQPQHRSTLTSNQLTISRKIHAAFLQWDWSSCHRLLVLLLTNGQFQVLNLHNGLRKIMTGSYLEQSKLSSAASQISLNLATSLNVYSQEYCAVLSQPRLGELLITEFSYSQYSAGPGSAMPAVTSATNTANSRYANSITAAANVVLNLPENTSTDSTSNHPVSNEVPASSADNAEVEVSVPVVVEEEAAVPVMQTANGMTNKEESSMVKVEVKTEESSSSTSASKTVHEQANGFSTVHNIDSKAESVMKTVVKDCAMLEESSTVLASSTTSHSVEKSMEKRIVTSSCTDEMLTGSEKVVLDSAFVKTAEIVTEESSTRKQSSMSMTTTSTTAVSN